MSKQDMLELEGVVVEALPNATFQVELERSQNFSTYFRQAANELHPHPSGRQGDGRGFAIRPYPRKNNMAIKISE